MAQIPAWLWLGAGITVVAGSIYVGEQVELFFYIGLLFVLLGTAKIVFRFVMRKSETKTEKKQMQRVLPRATHPHYATCSCGQYIRRTDNFCWCCGRRLR